MNARDVLAKLEKLGRAQTAAIYKRQGSGNDVFGVLTSEIAKLGKQIQVDHALAMELWRTGNAEARILALLIADPEQVSRSAAEGMIAEEQAHFLCCYLSALLARSPIDRKTIGAWMKSKDEDTLEVGYGVFSFRVRDDPSSVSDAEAARVLATIEKEIHRSPNWARYAMNGALIALGVSKPALRQAAREAARRIGDIDVDHGETTCKTPDALAHIERASKRKVCP